MPLILLGLGSVGIGFGAKLFGDGVEDTSKGVSRLVLAGAGGAIVYMALKKQGVV